jgi:hypothetical protein
MHLVQPGQKLMFALISYTKAVADPEISKRGAGALWKGGHSSKNSKD